MDATKILVKVKMMDSDEMQDIGLNAQDDEDMKQG